MKSRAYWFVSVVLASAAICVQVASLNEASKGSKLRAHAVTATEEQRETLDAEALQHANNSGATALAGLVAAIGGIPCLALSIKRHESAWRSIPVTLLGFYVLLQLTLI